MSRRKGRSWFQWAGAALREFAGLAPSAFESTFTYSAFANAANGSTETTLTFTAKDAAGNVMPNVPLTWTQERKILSASLSTVTATGEAILNDGIQQAVITAHVYDADSTPLRGIPSASLSLASTGTGNTITAVDSISDADGRFRWTLSSTVAEAKTLTLTACGLIVTDTAAVTVSASDAWLANLPAGPTEVHDRAFTNAGDITAITSGTAGGVTDATAPYSPDKVGQWVLPSGDGQGFGVGYSNGATGASTVRIYHSFNIKFSSNYTVHPSNQKILYHWRTTGGDEGSAVLGLKPGAGETDYTAGTLRFNLQTQTSDANRFLNENALTLVRDQWYHVEALLVMNTVAGTGDGIFQMWVDGTRIMNYSDVLYSDTGEPLEWRQADIDMYYGGNMPGHTIPSECYIYVDHWTLYSHTARS